MKKSTDKKRNILLPVFIGLFILVATFLFGKYLGSNSDDREINRQEAEYLALQEVKRIVRNLVENQKEIASEQFGGLGVENLKELEKDLQKEAAQFYVAYSRKEGGIWHVYIRHPEDLEATEVIVKSEDEIRIPKFEEALTAGYP